MRSMLGALLIALTGCHALYIDVDRRVEQRASQPIDFAPPVERLPDIEKLPTAPMKHGSLGAPLDDANLELAVALQKVGQPDTGKKQPGMYERLQLKEGILPIKIPELTMPTDPKDQKAR